MKNAIDSGALGEERERERERRERREKRREKRDGESGFVSTFPSRRR